MPHCTTAPPPSSLRCSMLEAADRPTLRSQVLYQTVANAAELGLEQWTWDAGTYTWCQPSSVCNGAFVVSLPPAIARHSVGPTPLLTFKNVLPNLLVHCFGCLLDN